MGYYVNPQGMSKDEWLESNGMRTTDELKWKDVLPGILPVVLVNNGLFTAAGICYRESELLEFLDPSDKRPKLVYLCLIDDLLKVSNLPKTFGS